MRIKVLAMDVDGTMTDGKIYIGNNGEVMKAFSVKDGQGISMLLEQKIIPVIITARESEIVKNRAKELHIEEIHQNCHNKIKEIITICERLKINPENIAYIGDDIGDIPVMRYVGYSFCPSDAVERVREEVGLVLSAKGGQGAVREAVEWIIRHNNR